MVYVPEDLSAEMISNDWLLRLLGWSKLPAAIAQNRNFRSASKMATSCNISYNCCFLVVFFFSFYFSFQPLLSGQNLHSHSTDHQHKLPFSLLSRKDNPRACCPTLSLADPANQSVVNFVILAVVVIVADGTMLLLSLIVVMLFLI